MKIHFYYRWSDLDHEHQFGVVPDREYSVYFSWVMFHLGYEFAKADMSNIRLYPYRLYDQQKPEKTYTTNGADKVAKLIFKRIKKHLK